MTGRDLISASLRLIGVKASGESLEASEATDGLASLNRMIGSWSNEGLLIHAITAETPLTLTAGDASITMGASGDITTRPQSIEKAVIRSGSMDYPLSPMTLEEYSSISNKSTQGIPDRYYDDGAYPQRTITFYPVPSSAYSFVPWTKRALTALTLDADISLPPGYEDALTYNLSIRLAPEYGKSVPAEVAAIAVETKDQIKSKNHRPSLLRCDDALVGHGGYDINRGY